MSGGLVLLGVLYRFVGDQTPVGLRSSPRLLVAILLIPVAIRLKSWAFDMCLLAFFAATTGWPRLRSEPAMPSTTVRLVSWNVGAVVVDFTIED